jgi:hypothetical protein
MYVFPPDTDDYVPDDPGNEECGYCGEIAVRSEPTGTWKCQHGTTRPGYVQPQANCDKCAVTPCLWTPVEVARCAACGNDA